MICPKCGNDNADGSKFCGKCGAVLSDKARQGISLANWNATHWLVLLTSLFSILCLCMRWFDVQYVGLLTDKARFSAFGLIGLADKLNSYLDLFDSGTNAFTLLFAEEFGPTAPCIIGIIVCVLLFAAGIVQLLVKDRAEFFCAASVFSIPYSLAMVISFPGTGLVVLTGWVWVYMILCLVNLLLFYRFCLKNK